MLGAVFFLHLLLVAVSRSTQASLLLDLQTGSWEADTFGPGFDAQIVHLPLLIISCSPYVALLLRCSPPSLLFSFFSIALCSSSLLFFFVLFVFRAVLLALGCLMILPEARDKAGVAPTPCPLANNDALSILSHQNPAPKNPSVFVSTLFVKFQANSPKRAQRLVQILTDLGPTFIKIGQAHRCHVQIPRMLPRLTLEYVGISISLGT